MPFLFTFLFVLIVFFFFFLEISKGRGVVEHDIVAEYAIRAV